MHRKLCTKCNLEKTLEDFYNKYRESKDCKSKSNFKRFYKNKENLSNQRNTSYEKKKGVLIAKSKVNQQNRKT